MLRRWSLCLLMLLLPSVAHAENEPAVDEHPPADERAPAFQIHLAIDLPVLGALTTITVTRLFAGTKPSCTRCDPKDVNSFDRVTAGYWNTTWQKAGDAALHTVFLGSALVLGIDEGVWRGLNDATVVTESIMAGAAFSSLLTLAAQRPRPFLYGDKAPMGPRTIPNASMSFLSGHAAAAFAASTAVFVAEHRLHPDSAGPWIILGTGSAIATFVSVARVMGGNHFISDNLFGALAGVSMGVLFPALHRQPVKLMPMAGETRGLALVARF